VGGGEAGESFKVVADGFLVETYGLVLDVEGDL